MHLTDTKEEFEALLKEEQEKDTPDLMAVKKIEEEMKKQKEAKKAAAATPAK